MGCLAGVTVPLGCFLNEQKRNKGGGDGLSEISCWCAMLETLACDNSILMKPVCHSDALHSSWFEV